MEGTMVSNSNVTGTMVSNSNVTGTMVSISNVTGTMVGNSMQCDKYQYFIQGKKLRGPMVSQDSIWFHSGKWTLTDDNSHLFTCTRNLKKKFLKTFYMSSIYLSFRRFRGVVTRCTCSKPQ